MNLLTENEYKDIELLIVAEMSRRNSEDRENFASGTADLYCRNRVDYVCGLLWKLKEMTEATSD